MDCWKVSALFAVSLAFFAASSALAQTEAELEESYTVFNRAKRNHQDHRYEEAIAEYKAAIRLDGNNPFMYNAMGLALAALQRFDEAIESFERSLALNPGLTDVYNNLGMVYAEMGNKEKAFEAFTKVVRDTNYPTPEKALYNLGNLYLEDDNYELALMHFQRSIDRQPKFALGYRGLAKVYLQLGEVESAEKNFEKAIEIFKDDSESLYMLGVIHQGRGEVEAAAELYRRVVEADRSSPFGQLSLASLDSLKASP